MKKNRSIIFTLLIILLLIFVSGLIFAVTLDFDLPFLEIDRPSQSEEASEEVPEQVTPSAMTDEEKAARLAEIEKILNDDHLVLVNTENGLGPDDEPVEFLTVEGYRLDKTAGENLQRMLTDMRAAGHETMTIYSAFRNYAKQESNFNNKINHIPFSKQTANNFVCGLNIAVFVRNRWLFNNFLCVVIEPLNNFFST